MDSNGAIWKSLDKNEKVSLLWNNELMSDITFVVDNKRFPAHKFVLACESEVFHNIFYGPHPFLEKEIQIEDCKKSEDFLEFLSLIYKKPAKVTWHNIKQLSHLKKKYTVSIDPKIFCNLLKSSKHDNVLEAFTVCVEIEEREMIEECMKAIRKDISNLVVMGQFLKLDQASLKEILKDGSLNIKEIDLLKAVDRWCSYQVERKKVNWKKATKRDVLGDALYHIRFPVLKMEDFSEFCGKSDILTDREYRNMSRAIWSFSRTGTYGSEADVLNLVAKFETEERSLVL